MSELEQLLSEGECLLTPEQGRGLLASKVERLAVAAVIAPNVREQHDAASSRRVALVDADGNITGYTTLAEVKKQILARAKIELDVTHGSKAKKLVCRACGETFARKAHAKVERRLCPACASPPCAQCSKPLSHRTAHSALRRGTDLSRIRCLECVRARCVNGHPRTPENEYRYCGRSPQCKLCALAARLRRRE